MCRLKSELRRHVSVAHYDGPYKCDQCPFEATKRWRLHEHVRFVHDKVNIEIYTKTFLGFISNFKIKVYPTIFSI